MATKKSTGLVKASGKDIALPQEMRERLLKLAQEQVASEAGTGLEANIIKASNKRFTHGEDVDLGEAFEAVVLDSVLINKFYDAPYVEGVVSPPACAAIGRDPSTLAPYAHAPGRAADKCEGCPNNEFGSASNGEGKACTNRRRLVVMLLSDAQKEGFDKAPLYTMELSPTALRGWARYVRSLARQYTIPPVACVTVFACEPSVKYSTIVPAFGRLLASHEVTEAMTRLQEANELAMNPVSFDGYEAPSASRSGKLAGKKGPAQRKGAPVVAKRGGKGR